MTYTFANKEDLNVVLEALADSRKHYYTLIKDFPNSPNKDIWCENAAQIEMIYADLFDLTSK